MSARAPLPSPRRLHLEVTNRCNSRCATCFRSARPEPERDLSVAEVARVAGDLGDLRTVALQVNGEPLLHPELEAIVALLSARGVAVELNTNGLSLTAARARALGDAGLRGLNVSLDGATAGTYRRLRGVDAFDRVVANLLALRAAETTPRPWLWMTLCAHNLEELPALLELGARVGARGVYLQRLVFFGWGLARREGSLHGRLDARGRALLAAARARAAELGLDLAASGGHCPPEMLSTPQDAEPFRACRRPHEGAVVMADGDVVPCCIATFVAPRPALRMGNALSQGWAEIWRGPAYARFRAALSDGEPPACCRRCGLDWSL